MGLMKLDYLDQSSPNALIKQPQELWRSMAATAQKTATLLLGSVQDGVRRVSERSAPYLSFLACIWLETHLDDVPDWPMLGPKCEFIVRACDNYTPEYGKLQVNRLGLDWHTYISLPVILLQRGLVSEAARVTPRYFALCEHHLSGDDVGTMAIWGETLIPTSVPNAYTAVRFEREGVRTTLVPAASKAIARCYTDGLELSVESVDSIVRTFFEDHGVLLGGTIL